MDKLISIIVPIYNQEDNLERCLDSLLAQTYQNIEIIAVDDGSTDASAEILKKYENDPKIRIVSKPNGGLSDARNAGIEIAKGDYFAFVDSDDYVKNDFIEYLYSLISSGEYDISSCGVINIMLSGREKTDSWSGEIILDKKEALERMLYNDKFYVTTWDKLYKRELFDEIRFPKGKLFEDTGTTYKLVMKSQRMIAGGKPEYYYVNSPNSITMGAFNMKKLDYVEMAENMASDIESKYPDLKKGANRKRLHALFSTLTQVAKSEKRIPEVEKMLTEKINAVKFGVFFDKKAPKRDKAAIISLSFGYPFFLFAWKIYRKLKK